MTESPGLVGGGGGLGGGGRGGQEPADAPDVCAIRYPFPAYGAAPGPGGGGRARRSKLWNIFLGGGGPGKMFFFLVGREGNEVSRAPFVGEKQ